MYLTKKEVVKILEVMENFPEVDKFDLDQDNNSGIGSLTTLTVPTTMYGIKGKFTIDISNVETW